MRCRCCDVLLTEVELQRKDPVTEEYADMCRVCFDSVRGAINELQGYDSTPIEDTSP